MRRLLFLPLLFTPIILLAQLQVSGKTMGEGEILPFAEVVLLDLDDELIKGDISDLEGQFAFTVSPGDYKLKISYLGYADNVQILLVNKSVDLGELILTPVTNSLQTVTVTTQKRLIERQADRLVFNVENSVAAKGSDLLSTLQLAPGVRVQNDEISLIGRGSTSVLINNRPVALSGEELTAYLRTLSADDVQKIEVITNPPAEYDAGGNGGLINIVLKRGRNNSWKNSMVLSHNQNDFGFTSLNNTFLYNRDQLSLSISGNMTTGANRELEWLDIYYPNGEWRMSMDGRGARNSQSARLALDYELNPGLTVGGQVLGTFGQPAYDGLATTTVRGPNGGIDSSLLNDMISDRSVNSYAYNLHLNADLDSLGRSLSIDLDYFDYDNNLEQSSTVNAFLPNDELIGTSLANQNFSLQQVDNLSAKIDFVHPIGDMNWTYGAKVSYIQTANDLESYNRLSGQPVFDHRLSNQFEYQENTQAVYLNAARSFGDQWEMKVGLRLESTQTEGYSLTLDDRTERSYRKLFPTFYLSYRPTDENQFSFSYGRRINRPGFRNLNPFRVYVNSNAYSEGNPFLQPSFTDNFELSYTHHGWLVTNLFYNHTEDGYGTFFFSDPNTEIQAVLRDNFYTENGFGIGEIISLDPISGWSSQNEIYLFNSQSEFKEGFDGVPQNGWLFYAATNNTIKLNEGSRLQLTFWYNSRHRDELFEVGAMYGLNLGFNQQLFNNKLQLSVMAHDVFNTGFLNSARSVVNGITSDYGQNYSSRHLRFSLTYNFGNDDVQVRQRKFGNEEERGRSN